MHGARMPIATITQDIPQPIAVSGTIGQHTIIQQLRPRVRGLQQPIHTVVAVLRVAAIQAVVIIPIVRRAVAIVRATARIILQDQAVTVQVAATTPVVTAQAARRVVEAAVRVEAQAVVEAAVRVVHRVAAVVGTGN